MSRLQNTYGKQGKAIHRGAHKWGYPHVSNSVISTDSIIEGWTPKTVGRFMIYPLKADTQTPERISCRAP